MDRTELAAGAGASPAEIERLTRLGLLTPVADGCFAPEDVSRVRLILALETAGITGEALAAALDAGSLSFRFADHLMAEPITLSTERYRDVIAAAGLEVDAVQRMWSVMGLGAFDPDGPVRTDDAELIAASARAAATGLDEELLHRSLRVFSTNLRRIAQYQRELFRQGVEDPLLEAGMSTREMLEATAPVRVALQGIGFRVTFLLLRRLLETEVFANLTERVERALDEAGVSRPRPAVSPAIAFVDMSGYTSMTAEAGDEPAAARASLLAELAVTTSRDVRGTVVKHLGDGVMLHFADAVGAVAGVLSLFSAAAAAGIPALHAGIATGPTVIRDGDYFGTTVNMASRLSAIAAAGEVIVTPGVVESCGEAVEFVPYGPRDLRGMREPVSVFRALWVR